MAGNLIKFGILTIILSLCERNVCAEENVFPRTEIRSDEIMAQLVSKKVEEILSSKVNEMENNIINKLTHFLNKKFDVIQNEIQESKIKFPGRAQIIPGEQTFPLVEINQTAKAYNQMVHRKKFAEVTVSWKTSLCSESGNRSVVTLDGREVWSGTGYETSATFKIYKGGRYQIQVLQCNGEKCSHSDSAEIVVADTDGSHLVPSRSSQVQNYFKPTSGKIVLVSYSEISKLTVNPGPIIEMPVHNVTHLVYAIIEICGAEDIERLVNYVPSCEPEDEFKVYVNSTVTTFANSTFSNQNYYYNGTFGQMMMMKKEKPDLKILATIGRELGNPFKMLDNEFKRDKFATSVKEFLRTWKFFDGVDIAWINFDPWAKLDPNDDLLENLMKKLRESLDELSQETNKKYLLTLTLHATPHKLLRNNFGIVNKYVDNFLLLTFLYKESWLDLDLGHQSGLYAPAWKPNENYTTDFAVKQIQNQGVSREKIVISVSLNGVGYSGIQNYSDDNPFTGQYKMPYSGGYIEPASMRDELVLGTWEHRYDNVAEAAYLFNKDTGDLISYDDARSARAKAKYVIDNNFEGLYLMGDYVGNADLLEAINTGLGNKL